MIKMASLYFLNSKKKEWYLENRTVEDMSVMSCVSPVLDIHQGPNFMALLTDEFYAYLTITIPRLRASAELLC